MSNDELLEILSDTRDPLKVQPHLSKCFDALKKLTFGEGEACNEMIALNSSEGEQVPTTEGLTRTPDPNPDPNQVPPTEALTLYPNP